jgi:NADH-quinone oxidoreductase subunit M
MWFSNHILSVVLFVPLLGAIALLFLPKENKNLIRLAANVFAFVGFLVSLPLVFWFDSSHAEFQFVERAEWIPSIGASYHLGIDGISLLLIMLTTVLGFIAILSSWTAIEDRVKEYYVFLLILQTGMLGVFMTNDFFLFYVFWEVMLVPMYFLIGIWGGAQKLYAAIKFFVYTLVGSVLMLLGILTVYFWNHGQSGEYTFDIVTLSSVNMPASYQFWVFLAFFVGFAIKVPMFPFHTWLPDAHVQAPTAGSVILAGVLLKMGGYGFIRFSLPMFPQASADLAWLVFGLSMVAVVYTSLVALVQSDMKKLIAYSSVAHMAIVTAGLFAFNQQGIEGAMMVMLGHGLVSGALFLCVGVIYDRLHTREIGRYGGLSINMPRYAVLFLLFTMASVGLPGTSNFVGELLSLVGIYEASSWVAFICGTGVILGAAYMLYLYRRICYGEQVNKDAAAMPDLSMRELWLLAPIAVVVLWMGVYPESFLEPMRKDVMTIAARMEPVKPAGDAQFKIGAAKAAEPQAHHAAEGEAH